MLGGGARLESVLPEFLLLFTFLCSADHKPGGVGDRGEVTHQALTILLL